MSGVFSRPGPIFTGEDGVGAGGEAGLSGAHFPAFPEDGVLQDW